jgi:septum formation protein
VRVVPSGVDEGDRPGHDPRELAALHASAKAEAVARREPGPLIVAADTVVDVDGRALGKPADAHEAVTMLRTLSGREHLVHTAYVAQDGERRISGGSSTRVLFSRLEEATIERYVASGEPFDKAGGYGIQGRGAALVASISGDFYTVMGFPLGEFVRRLPELGYVLAPARAGATP